MRIDVIALFPELVKAVAENGIVARACERGILQLYCWNPRDETHDRHRTVDDRPYGGGPGMVLKVAPLRDTLQRLRQQASSRGHSIYLSPQGAVLNQQRFQELAGLPHLVLVAGRYEGVDERFIDLEVDEECSLGDYVLSGGELAAMVMVDAVCRLLPGALGAETSAEQDSFSAASAGLLDYPHYTRPERIVGRTVPEVLLSGNHDAIRRWRLQQSLGRTWLRRPELLSQLNLTTEQQQLLNEFIDACLAHQQGEPGVDEL